VPAAAVLSTLLVPQAAIVTQIMVQRVVQEGPERVAAPAVLHQPIRVLVLMAAEVDQDIGAM
jgi:hypothetical protein